MSAAASRYVLFTLSIMKVTYHHINMLHELVKLLGDTLFSSMFSFVQIVDLPNFFCFQWLFQFLHDLLWIMYSSLLRYTIFFIFFSSSENNKKKKNVLFFNSASVIRVYSFLSIRYMFNFLQMTFFTMFLWGKKSKTFKLILWPN